MWNRAIASLNMNYGGDENDDPRGTKEKFRKKSHVGPAD
jgi:hypothetical protein